MSNPNDKRPLEGVRVVDWTHVLAGPFAGYQLGLLGADVIRIDRTDADEMIRSTAVDPELGRLGLGETFVGQGGGKRSLALDAKNPLAQDALRRLIADADVLLENFRPGKLAQLGFDPAELVLNHPRLVVCSITGFGPGSDRRAYDHIVQGASGLMAANANGKGIPQRVGFPLVDYAVGQQAAFAVMAALYRRDAGRESARTSGEWLQVTMADAALTLMAPAYIETLVSGKARPRSASTAFSGSPVSGTFKVADGWLAIVCNAQVQTEGLLSGLQESGAGLEPLANLRAAVESRDVDQAQQLLAGLLGAEAGCDWEQRLSRWGVPITVVRSPVEAAVEASKGWPCVNLPRPGRAQELVPVPGIGFTSSKPLTPPLLRTPPRRGADSRSILDELGFTREEVDRMIAAGVAAEPG